ncbi:MAG: endo-1,4-beta-xylanase [Clostridiales bacterium]|nr:endo-1,4-beta-xylanase [Clostridiales bacterium]
MKKKFFAITLLLVLSFAACGRNSVDEEILIETPDELEAAEPESTPAATPEPEPEVITMIEIDPEAYSFEADSNGFSARGSGEITRTDEVSRAGEYSLLVTGRTASWNGISLDVTDISEPFGEYEFSLWVMPTEESGATTFQLSAEFVVRGNPSWHHFTGTLANVTAQPGEWTRMTGKLPFENFNNASVYIETNGLGASASFYIDDVTFRSIAEESVFDNMLPRLFEVYADYFDFGTAVVTRDLQDERADFIRHHFNTITVGNDMKPSSLQNTPGRFTWNAADEIAGFARENNMYLIGHTLVWHEQSPEWMNRRGMSREEAINNLESHIEEVVSRYAGQIIVWDVVNEAFTNSADLRNAENWRTVLRQTPWLEVIGDDYIEIAFRAAHTADPNAILIYNDFNLDEPGKREAVFHMVQELLENGVPIHGIGMQGHYNTGTRPANVEASILRFAELGIPVHITELDITVNAAQGHETLSEAHELQQALLYARLFRIFRENSDVIDRVTVWGLDDASSWRADRFPLAFNRNLSAKLSYYAILDPDAFLEEHDAS